MARIKRTLVIKRNGSIAKVTRPTKKAKKSKRSKRLSKQEVRLNTNLPQRKDLTTSQWQEWGDNLKVLRRHGVPYSEWLSLQEQRDLLDTIRINEQYFVAVAYRKGIERGVRI